MLYPLSYEGEGGNSRIPASNRCGLGQRERPGRHTAAAMTTVSNRLPGRVPLRVAGWEVDRKETTSCEPG